MVTAINRNLCGSVLKYELTGRENEYELEEE